MTVEKDNQINKIDFIGKRILLAEDNEFNLEIATDYLEDLGFIVENAKDGEICVDMMSKAEPGYYDFILMDIQMPNLDGYGATLKIRSMDDSVKANIPIIAMSANVFDEDKDKSNDVGMNGYIVKPIDIKNVLKVLGRVIDTKII